MIHWAVVLLAFKHVYQPVGDNIVLSAIVAAAPLFVLFIMLALLRLPVKLRENRDFDGTRRRHRLIGVQQIFLVGGEVQDGHGKHAIELAVYFLDRRREFLPQDLLFLLGILLGTRRQRCAGTDRRYECPSVFRNAYMNPVFKLKSFDR